MRPPGLRSFAAADTARSGCSAWCRLWLKNALGQELRERALARPEIGNHHRRHQLQQRFRQTFPAAAGDIVAPELAGQLVEIAPHFVSSLFEHELERPGIIPRFRDFRRSRVQKVYKLPVANPIKTILALLPILHQTRAFELGKVRGNAALPHREDFLKFGYGQLFALQQQQQAQAAGIGNQLESLEN